MALLVLVAELAGAFVLAVVLILGLLRFGLADIIRAWVRRITDTE